MEFCSSGFRTLYNRFLVIIYAISGNLGAIANIAKLVSILQAVVGIAVTVWLANDPSMQGYFGTPFEFIFAIGIPTVLWIILFYWATAKMDQQKKLGSTTLENKIGSDKKIKLPQPETILIKIS
jgi:uncharacterized membrane protein